jgi:hypothetical protein
MQRLILLVLMIKTGDSLVYFFSILQDSPISLLSKRETKVPGTFVSLLFSPAGAFSEVNIRVQEVFILIKPEIKI